jgi:hypothetical protein
MTALMNKFGSWFLLLLILGLTEPFQVGVAHGQTAACKGEIEDSTASSVVDPCVDPSTHPALKEAMQFLCLRPRLEFASCSAPKAIVVGFVGGFVKPNDVKHPEVVFAHYLRSRYGSAIHTEMFGNHDAKGAAEHLADWLNASGLRTSIEKKDIKIILYGHSWGASEVLAFARELQRREIPVSLTIQIDSVRKLHQNDRTVPANVEKAVNFYQTHGLTPGQKLIVPADPTRTRILGNYRMTYQDHQIRCDNYKWLSRAFNKPHHQIENDPHVWDQVGLLIDSELTDARTAPTPSSTDFDEDTVARSQNDKK